MDVLERVLHKARFVPCGPTQPESSGWVPPRGKKSKVLAEIVGGHLLLKLCTEKRAVPSSAVKAAVDERIERYQQETGNERVPAKVKKALEGSSAVWVKRAAAHYRELARQHLAALGSEA